MHQQFGGGRAAARTQHKRQPGHDAQRALTGLAIVDRTFAQQINRRIKDSYRQHNID